MEVRYDIHHLASASLISHLNTFLLQYYHLADKFGRGFEEAFAALRRLEDSKADLERIPSVDEKLQLSYDIFKVKHAKSMLIWFSWWILKRAIICVEFFYPINFQFSFFSTYRAFFSQITNTDMARVLTILESTCPNALSKKVSTDEVLINFDALTPRCFHEVNSFVLNCFLNISGSKKNKKRKLTTESAEGGNNDATTTGNNEADAATAVGASSSSQGNEKSRKTDARESEEAEF